MPTIDHLPTEILTAILKLVCTQNLLQEYQYEVGDVEPEEYSKPELPTTLTLPVITLDNLPSSSSR